MNSVCKNTLFMGTSLPLGYGPKGVRLKTLDVNIYRKVHNIKGRIKCGKML